MHVYFFNGPGDIDLKTLHFIIDDYGSICVVQYQTKKSLILSQETGKLLSPLLVPPPPHANNDPLFPMKLQRMVTFHFRGGGGSEEYFIYGPLGHC